MASANDFNASLPANASFNAAGLANLPSSFQFSYDPGENLISSTVKAFGIPSTTPMPSDASGRNRPGTLGGLSLAYDANGNLISKGDLHFHYDFRNRLTRMTDALGAEVASYTYDAMNRRVEKRLPGTTLTTAWSGWRALEEYANGVLSRRRFHGVGLDEIVREQLDVDGDGLMEPGYVPLYDSIGNLVALTDLDGDALERARFSPFGLGSLRVDATPPNLEQIVFRNGLIRMGFSEEVSTDGLLATIDAGGIHIEQFDPNQPELPPVDLGPIDLKPLQAEFCDVELGCVVGVGGSTAGALSSLAGAASTRDITSSLRSPGASRWVDLTVANPPAPGSQVRLTLAAGAFEDLFQNPSTDGMVEEFTWGPGETVLLDATPPRVRAVRLLDGHLEIELNEEPELGTAQAAIDVGQPATWALSADGLTLRSEASLLAGDYTLTIQPTLADRAGLNLQQLFELSLLIPAIEPNAVFFEEPDPQEVASSSVGNLYGLHGLPRDPESGLVYARNRYYDPEMGRFVTADPLGYVDGPSMYGFAGYNPVNFGDPMGLQVAPAVPITAPVAPVPVVPPSVVPPGWGGIVSGGAGGAGAVAPEVAGPLALCLASPLVCAGAGVVGWFGGRAIGSFYEPVPGYTLDELIQESLLPYIMSGDDHEYDDLEVSPYSPRSGDRPAWPSQPIFSTDGSIVRVLKTPEGDEVK